MILPDIYAALFGVVGADGVRFAFVVELHLRSRYALAFSICCYVVYAAFGKDKFLFRGIFWFEV